MKVTLAKSAGFCFGVKRAVEMVYKEAETGKKVYTLGPIIHNEQVVQDLEQKGVRVIDTPEELSEAEDATVIIRSHGISADVYHQLEDKRFALLMRPVLLSARSIALLRKNIRKEAVLSLSAMQTIRKWKESMAGAMAQLQ